MEEIDPVYEFIDAPKGGNLASYDDDAVNEESSNAWFDNRNHLNYSNSFKRSGRHRKCSSGIRKNREPTLDNWKARLTVPESPFLLTNERATSKKSNSAAKSSEEVELHTMREHQEEREKRRRLNEQLMQKALAPAQSYFPGRSMKALTEPEEFHFHTEKREQLRALSYQKEAEDTIVHENCIPGSGDFIYSADRISGKGHANDKFSNTQIGKHCSLKRKRTPGTETIGRLTVPSPFNFASEERALQRGTTSTENEPYVPLLQQTLEYSTRTPKRFRTACDYVKTSRKSEPSISRPTIPEAFHFETEERSQIYPREEVLSSSEREILEMEKMSKFKARPLDRRIFENGGALGIRKVDKMPTTVPQCFSLATDNRIRNAVDLASSSSSFDDCREDPLARTTSKEQSWKPVLTEPRSPNLATKNRAMLSLSQHSNSEVPKDHSFFHARPVPTGSPFRPTNVPKELTKPEPIQLRTEDRALRHEKELAEAVEKMRREEESARIFKAKPMRIVEHPLVPEKIRKSTITDPFPLCTEERGIVAANKFKIKVDKRLQEEYERAQFRAKPFVTKVPFEPAKSTRPLTEIREVTLNSDQRALKRQDFDNFLLQKEISYQLAKRKLDEERREAEMKELIEYRKALVHKALPVPDYFPFEVKLPKVPLTQPESPRLKTKRRCGMRDL